ncbi:MAG TPA: C40 family peptidase [Hyphomicrobiaceae bacterium]|nr:C40 family peptidase [Hyphomicrobiaceae bacterium]
MTGAAARPDPRRHAWREDLAAESLRGQVEAPRYVAGEPHHVIRPAIALRREPQFTASIETEALFGEAVTVYDITDGWAWAQLERDRYVGYLPADALRRGVAATTHRVSAIGTFIYSAADIKAPPLMHLSLNAQVAVVERQERFSRLAGGGFVVNRHIIERDRYARDFVDVAERLIGTPYLWGGRTRLGLDCSGLVQIAMEAAGIRCPRDTDMQQAELGSEVLVPASLEGLKRGDLVFWRGHVGIMVDGLMMVHANAHHMAVAVEPLAVAVERIGKSEGGMASVRRLPKLCGDGT